LWDVIEDAITAAKLQAEATQGAPARIAVTNRQARPENRRVKDEYRRTYDIVKFVRAILGGRAKLGGDYLVRICEAHDDRRVPIPESCDWGATTWREALGKQPRRVKGWIAQAVDRHHKTLARSFSGPAIRR
jgi:hypothetical protein